MRELRTNAGLAKPVEDQVSPYLLEGELIHGVRWSGTNLSYVKQIIGYRTEGVQYNGKLHVFGRPIEVGDFVYTTALPHHYIPTLSRGLFGGNLQENDVFIIVNGEYTIIRED